MLSTQAHVATDRPSRYLVQLCKHFARKGRHLSHRPRAHLGQDAQSLREMRAAAEGARVDWNDTEGSVYLPWGAVILHSTPGVLVLRAEATDKESLRRLEELVTGHLERFGRRDGLQVTWQEPSPAAAPGLARTAGLARPPAGPAAARSRRLQLVGLAAVVLVLAAHLGLEGILAANWHWTGGAVGALLALLLLKTALLGGFAAHRRATKRR
ncbi:hypothetical protein GCM10018789_59860 [Streptomyces werraensis]|nr:hypothetical protein GCM10018789_59860 [Streptomyces werraensis]